MIRRFYGSHVDSVLETGTVYVEKEKAIRDKRFGALDKLIADMKEVSDTPEIYTYTAESMETEDVAEFREQIANSREVRVLDDVSDENSEVEKLKSIPLGTPSGKSTKGRAVKPKPAR
jgi:hypothetical protein